jgi:transposase
MDGPMAVPRAPPVRLSAAQRHRLKKTARGHKSPHRDRLRAQIVLDAAAGHANAAIARRLGVTADTARKWRGRFASDAFDGPGRPETRRPPAPVHPVQQAQVKALACELPAASGVPLSRWSAAEVADEAVTAGLVDAISGAIVRRWRRADALKPWQYRSWIAPRAPDFAARAAVVLDLYAASYDGEPLGEGDFVLCSDEKTSIQARCRCHPTLPPAQARAMRVEHEYQRRGALVYLAAWDAHRGKVFGRCEPTTGIAPFARLVQQVMTIQPYASARRVFWVVDNGSSHRGQASIDRMAKAWPTTTLVHTPIHASWLNQCEIYFSVVQRKVVTPNDFPDLAESRTGWRPSRSTTTSPPDRSTGPTPPRTLTISSTASPPTTPARWQPPHDPDELPPRTT